MIHVLLVDDNPIVRAALRGFLDSTDEVRVVGEANHGQEAWPRRHSVRRTSASASATSRPPNRRTI
jgi:DNA-binding NarL/FixJ family response regulator